MSYLDVVVDNQFLRSAILHPRQELKVFGRNVSGEGPEIPDLVLGEKESGVRSQKIFDELVMSGD